MKRLTLFYLILIILISLFGVKALFHPGFYTNHDGEHQVLRLYHFDKAIKDGQIPPRWAGNQMLNGYGYPLFIFSYQAPWIMAEPLRLIGLSLTDTVKIVFILTYLFSGIFMFLWLKKIFGRLPALIGSILYLWAPYRFSNIFVRASLGEATAFMFIPLIFYGLDQLNEKKGLKGILIGGLGFCGLILSHAMAAFIFVFPILLYLLINFSFSQEFGDYSSSEPRMRGESRSSSTSSGWSSRQARTIKKCMSFVSKKRILYFKKSVLLFTLGFALSAYYTLPALFEKKFTRFSQIFPSMFASHFVTLKQLLYSPWGYGFSLPGVENDEMAFQIGISHWLVLFFTIILIGWIFLTKKKFKIAEKKNIFKSMGFIFSFLLSILMMIEISNPIWRLLTKFIPFDFPWRFLGLAVFSLSFLSSFIIWLLKKFISKELAFLICLVLLFFAFYGNRNHLRVNQYLHHHDSYYEKITNSTTSYDEFLPIWLKQKIDQPPKDTVEVLKGKALIQDLKQESAKISFRIETEEKDVDLRVNTLFFPGWKLFINGKKHQFNFEKSGLIEFNPPFGQSEVLLIFDKTMIRIIGEIISFSALVFIALWLLRFRWQ